jgi:hypothetical protein
MSPPVIPFNDHVGVPHDVGAPVISVHAKLNGLSSLYGTSAGFGVIVHFVAVGPAFTVIGSEHVGDAPLVPHADWVAA